MIILRSQNFCSRTGIRVKEHVLVGNGGAPDTGAVAPGANDVKRAEGVAVGIPEVIADNAGMPETPGEGTVPVAWRRAR